MGLAQVTISRVSGGSLRPLQCFNALICIPDQTDVPKFPQSFDIIHMTMFHCNGITMLSCDIFTLGTQKKNTI